MSVSDGRNCTYYLQWLDFRKGILDHFILKKVKELTRVTLVSFLKISINVFMKKAVSSIAGELCSVY